MRCPSCNHDSTADSSFCKECGAKLELGARFGKKCGTAIGPRKAAASATVSSIKSEIIVAADAPASGATEGRAQDGDGAVRGFQAFDCADRGTRLRGGPCDN